LGGHPHSRNGTTKRQVAAMFERPTLLPLPLEPFRYYQYGERSVHLLHRSRGCLLRRTPGLDRTARAGSLGSPRLLNPNTGELLREHLHQTRGGRRVKEEDRPTQTQPGTVHLLIRARPCWTEHQHCLSGHARGEAAVRRIAKEFGLSRSQGHIGLFAARIRAHLPRAKSPNKVRPYKPSPSAALSRKRLPSFI
jgi:hypothetical protein